MSDGFWFCMGSLVTILFSLLRSERPLIDLAQIGPCEWLGCRFVRTRGVEGSCVRCGEEVADLPGWAAAWEKEEAERIEIRDRQFERQSREWVTTSEVTK